MTKIPFLDGARGIAALLVLFSHIYLGLFNSYPILSATIIAAGHSGVELFFILSGFLIGGQFWKNIIEMRNFNFQNYFVRRALRVLPLFYISFAAFFIAYFFLNHREPNFSIVPFYLLQLHNFFSDVNIINPPTWTFAVEIHFYLFIALFFYVLRNKSVRVHLIGILLLFVCVAMYRYYAFEKVFNGGDYRNLVYANSFARMDHFFMGVLLAFLYFKADCIDSLKKWGGGILALLSFVLGIIIHSVLIYFEYSYRNIISSDSIYFSVNIVGPLTALAWSFIVLSGILQFKPLTSVLSLRPLRYFGDISYSLYLLHLPIFSYLFKPLFVEFVSTNMFFCAICFIPIIIGICALSYNYIEKPFLRVRGEYI